MLNLYCSLIAAFRYINHRDRTLTHIILNYHVGEKPSQYKDNNDKDISFISKGVRQDGAKQKEINNLKPIKSWT